MNGKDNFLGTQLARILITIICCIGVWGIFISSLESNNTVISVIVVLICMWFGWQKLERLQPDIIPDIFGAGIILYFIIKFIISIMIGMFVAPFYIGGKLGGFIHDLIR